MESEAATATQPESVRVRVDEHGNLVIPATALRRDPDGELRIVAHAGFDQAGPRLLESMRFRILLGTLVGIVAIFAVNGRNWPWTGFAGATSLWSWLKLLVTPAALASLIVRLNSPASPGRTWRTLGLAAGVLFVATIIGGYWADWGWTGFPGKALWDWLELMLFPLVILVLPEWVRHGGPRGRRAAIIAIGASALFALIVIGGYSWGWTWTGFTGNTFRDWLALMIAPFLLPVTLKVVQAHHSARRSSAAADAMSELGVQVERV